MLKVDLDVKRNRATIAAAGSGLEILADVTFLIGEIHKSMNSDNAKAFKELIKQCITDEDSPVWDHEEKTGKKTDGVKRVHFVFPGMPE
ncbi:MAG: hypothetical protein ACI3XG_02830 [Faecousia sp.]